MIKISVDREEAERQLGRWLYSTENTLDPAKASARYLRKQLAQSFDAQRDPYGNAWRPLADSTLKLRQRRGNYSTRILFDTGAMRRSLRVRDDTVEIRTPAEYHQFGVEPLFVFGRPIGTLPIRMTMPYDAAGNARLPEAWADEIALIFARWVLEN